MTIGFIVPSFEVIGGLELMSLRLAHQFLLIGWRVVIFTTCVPSKNILQQFSDICFRKIEYDIQEFESTLKSDNISLLIYHGFYVETNHFINRWAKISKIPLISVLHNKPIQCPIEKGDICKKGVKSIVKKILFPLYKKHTQRLVNKYYKEIIKSSQKVVVLSPKYISSLSAIDIKASGKICCIPNFIEKPVISEAQDDKSGNRLLYLGRIDERQKKFSRIISIWEKVNELLPDWSIDIVGSGPLLNYWKDYCNNNNVPRILFHGHVSPVHSYLQSSDILLMTSDFEGLPLSLCEGVVNGCIPILYNTFDAASDIIPAEANYLLVPPIDEDEFIKRLLNLAKDKSLRCRHKDILKQHISKFFPEEIMPQWTTLINEVLSSAKTSD